MGFCGLGMLTKRGVLWIRSVDQAWVLWIRYVDQAWVLWIRYVDQAWGSVD